MVEKQPISKYITYGDKSTQDFKNSKHDSIYKESIENKQKFFDAQAKKIHWHKMHTKVLDTSD